MSGYGRNLAWLLAAMCGACSGEGGGSAGAADADAEHRIGEPDLVLGNEQAGLAAEFGGVAGLALDSAGRIFVADAQANEVRVFGPAGDHLYSIGRAGSGPGEFAGPCCLAFDDAGRLWVRDGGNARYEIFLPGDAAARPATSVRMSHGDVNRWAPVTFDAAGRVIDIGFQPSNGVDVPRTGRMHLDDRGAVARRTLVPAAPAESLALHTIQRSGTSGVSTFYLYQPHGPLELVAHGAGGEFAHAISSRYSIAWFDEYGDTLRVIERPGEPGPALSPAERTRAERRIESDIQRLAIPRGQIPFDVPQRKTPLRTLYFDADGRLWVELSVADGEDRRAHVYDRDGRLAFSAQWPAGIAMQDNAIYGDVALGVARDSLDVQRVIRLRFRRAR